MFQSLAGSFASIHRRRNIILIFAQEFQAILPAAVILFPSIASFRDARSIEPPILSDTESADGLDELRKLVNVFGQIKQSAPESGPPTGLVRLGAPVGSQPFMGI